MNRASDPSRDSAASAARPLGATLAAAVLAMLGAGMALVAFGELARDPVPSAADPADEVTAIFAWLTTVMRLAFAVAILSVVAVHAYVAVRIWIGARWAWVEGLFVVPLGAITYFGLFGLDEHLKPTVTPGLIMAAGGYIFVVVALLVARDWVGTIALSPERSDRPWWLRGRRF